MVAAKSVGSVWAYHRRKQEARSTIAERNSLVTANMGLVYTAAHRMTANCNEPFEDLVNFGVIGLIKALERFDPHQGKQLSTFAMPYIRGEMQHFLRYHGSNVKIPRAWREQYAAGKRVERKIIEKFGKKPGPHLIAARLGMPLEKWQKICTAIENQFATVLDDERHAETEAIAEKHHQPAALEQAWSTLKPKLEQLPTLEQELVKAVYLHNESRKAVGQRLNLKPTALKRRLNAALELLAN